MKSDILSILFKGVLWLSCAFAVYRFYNSLPRRNLVNRKLNQTAVSNMPKVPEVQWNASFPRDFILSKFPPSDPNSIAKQKYKDRYIGTYMNAGVIYDEAFLRKQDAPSFREPSAYTPFPQDYIHYVKRPEPKPFPTY